MYYRFKGQSSLLFIWYRSRFNEETEATTLFRLILRLITNDLILFPLIHLGGVDRDNSIFIIYYMTLSMAIILNTTNSLQWVTDYRTNYYCIFLVIYIILSHQFSPSCNRQVIQQDFPSKFSSPHIRNSRNSDCLFPLTDFPIDLILS